MPRHAHRPTATGLPRLRVVFLTSALIAGCASQPGGDRVILSRWTQLGPEGISLRAIVAGDECPQATVDGVVWPLKVRAAAHIGDATAKTGSATTNRAFAPDFPVTSCELNVPAAPHHATLDGWTLPLPLADSKRVVVLGDTGCRIKVPANGAGDPIQNCADEAAWPWRRIATAAARLQPDLVIHLGDYHYREYCDHPALCAPLKEKNVRIGYGWDGWDADFFSPAEPLLAVAPWIVVRGNHENCDRGGEGWMRFLSPVPYRACDNQLIKTASRSVLTTNATNPTYRVNLAGLPTLLVADNAGHEDYRAVGGSLDEVLIFKRNLKALLDLPKTEHAWLLIHKPIWYDLLDAPSQPNALQMALDNALPTNVQFVFSGHEHAFQTLNFVSTADPSRYPAGRPAQVIVGASGTQLEAFDPQSPFYEGESGRHGKERARPDSQRLYEGAAADSGVLINRYSFLLLERTSDEWHGSLRDPDGKIIGNCQLNRSHKQIACDIPGR